MECVFLDYDKLLNEIKRIHFIGIGGSGMCPIAEILMSEGYEISGSDMNEGETLDKMKGYGIPVYMGHAAENIKGAELVVYSAAVKETNPERQAAAEQGIPCIERSVMLGVVTRRYRRSIAVSGTHGKTSTTAMLSQILIGSGFDPSAIIGGKLPFIGGNSYVGQSDIIVCEACEYVDTFLELNPFISIILNVDADHLDYFKNLDNIKKSFHQFAKQTTGLLVLNGDDANTLDSVKDVQLEKITFGFGENCDYRAVNVSADKGVHEQYDLYHHGEKLCSVKLIVPGKHNVYNSLAAAATAHYLGATPAEISENLHKFGGVHRRFEILGTPATPPWQWASAMCGRCSSRTPSRVPLCCSMTLPRHCRFPTRRSSPRSCRCVRPTPTTSIRAIWAPRCPAPCVSTPLRKSRIMFAATQKRAI